MEARIKIDPAEAEASRRRLLERGRIIRNADELYGPQSDADDPEDVDAFLSLLEEERRQALAPRERP